MKVNGLPMKSQLLGKTGTAYDKYEGEWAPQQKWHAPVARSRSHAPTLPLPRSRSHAPAPTLPWHAPTLPWHAPPARARARSHHPLPSPKS